MISQLKGHFKIKKKKGRVESWLLPL